MNTHVSPAETGQIVAPDITTAKQFLAALLGPDAPISIRLIWQKGETPVPDGRQTVLTFHNPSEADWWSIWNLNLQGYAVFFFVNELDGTGGTSDSNVVRIRANFVDLDNISTATDSASRMISEMRPAIWVGSSPGKHHLYFRFPHYADPAHFRVHQQKLAIRYGGDASVSNPARIMRLPGFLHQKGAPFLVRWEPVTGGQDTTPEALAAALQGVQVLQEGAGGTRHPLGTLMQAPSREWLQAALDAIDPNDLDRLEWVKVYCAIMQAGWSVCHRDEIWQMLDAWCARFNRQWVEDPSKRGNDPDDNRGVWVNAEKQGVSTGIPTILRAIPTDARAHLEAELRRFDPYAAFSGMSAVAIPVGAGVPQPASVSPVAAWEGGKHPLHDQYGPMLLAEDCRDWFAGCAFISSTGEMFTPFGMMKEHAFKAKYGGKRFTIQPSGQPTDDAWKAATRSVFWTVPKIDRLRFKPNERFGEILKDELGRMSINIYRPASIETIEGDPEPFLHHLSLVMPDEGDRRILLDFMAHNAKYPGYKIPWAPLIQSTEGIGKGVFKQVMEYVMGYAYTYFPNAKHLNDSGSKFNGWMDQKLFFVTDEIRTDEKRDMVEVLKPIISECELEIQGKGKDQVKADNPGNWLFFSNHKDAIPVNKNSRRFAIFYSPIQSESDLIARRMDDAYFRWLFGWLDADGARTGLKVVAHYLLNYSIERGAIPMRAPHTTSQAEAVSVSLGPIASRIMDAIEAEEPGFRGGWINRDLARDIMKREYTTQTITKVIVEELGGTYIGRHPTPIFQEQNRKPRLFRTGEWRSMQHYAVDQGYMG